MEDPEAKPADRLTAARMILDRAVGTPVAAVEVTSHLSVSLVELLATLPGQPRPAPIEHDAPPPPLVAGISLMEAAEAAAELEGQEAARQVEEAEEEGELILRPANDDGTPTQPGGE